VGLGDFFRRRRERESAIPPSAQIDQPSEALGSFASAEGQPVVGRQVGGDQFGSGDFGDLPGMADGLAALTQLGPMIQKAIAEGNVQIDQGGSQTIDLRGTGLREEILGIMQQHGIDAESGSAQNVDAGGYGDMQRQILEALARHGIDPGASGTSLNFQLEQKDE
jgi:hypothetical protein